MTKKEVIKALKRSESVVKGYYTGFITGVGLSIAVLLGVTLSRITVAIDVNQLINTAIAGVITSIPTAIVLYLGFVKGTGKTVDIAITKIEEKYKHSPTANRLLKFIETSEKLFGDDQAVEQITGFFKEARELVSSSEAKNFFKNVSDLMKDLGSEGSEVGKKRTVIKLPKKP